MRSQITDDFITKMADKPTPYFKTINKIKLRIDKDVYATGKIGKLFYKTLSLPLLKNNLKHVLDYGTGTGFLAILSALKGATVVATDINQSAVNCAKYNAKRNNVEARIDFRIGSHLEAIKSHEKFDLILGGLPWENAIPNNDFEKAFYDPDYSMKKVLANHLDTLLKKDGILLLSYSKRMQDKMPMENFFPNCDCKIYHEEIINGVTHYILGLKIKL